MTDGIGLTEVQRERAEFIERMARELSRIATGSDLHFIGYLLDMASEEAGLLRDGAHLQAIPIQPGDGRIPRALRRT